MQQLPKEQSIAGVTAITTQIASEENTSLWREKCHQCHFHSCRQMPGEETCIPGNTFCVSKCTSQGTVLSEAHRSQCVRNCTDKLLNAAPEGAVHLLSFVLSRGTEGSNKSKFLLTKQGFDYNNSPSVGSPFIA